MKRLEKKARVVEHGARTAILPTCNRSANRLAPPEAAGESCQLEGSKPLLLLCPPCGSSVVTTPVGQSRALMEAIAALPRLRLARPTTMSSACVHAADAAARRFGLHWAFCFCGQAGHLDAAKRRLLRDLTPSRNEPRGSSGAHAALDCFQQLQLCQPSRKLKPIGWTLLATAWLILRSLSLFSCVKSSTRSISTPSWPALRFFLRDCDAVLAARNACICASEVIQGAPRPPSRHQLGARERVRPLDAILATAQVVPKL